MDPCQPKHLVLSLNEVLVIGLTLYAVFRRTREVELDFGMIFGWLMMNSNSAKYGTQMSMHGLFPKKKKKRPLEIFMEQTSEDNYSWSFACNHWVNSTLDAEKGMLPRVALFCIPCNFGF